MIGRRNHHLDYGTQEGESGPGFLGVCRCGDFRVWIEGVDADTESALLGVHAFHVRHPELGK